MSNPFQFKKVIQVAAGHEHILLLAEKQTDVRFIFKASGSANDIFLGRRKTPRNLIR